MLAANYPRARPIVLPAELRLRDSESFRRAVRRGIRSGGPALVVHVDSARVAPAHVDPACDGAPPRFGLIVSRAVGNAVVRNRVKRRLRHLLSSQVTAVPAGSAVVVRALPAAAGLSSMELRDELARCLGRATRRITSGSAS